MRAEPTFLYAMHLDGDRYFVQETSLIARPAPNREFMAARLYARTEALGTPPHDTESDEWVAFPMNAPAPAPGACWRLVRRRGWCIRSAAFRWPGR